MSMYGNKKGKMVYSIPVEWVVTENIEVRADSLKEALEFVKKHNDEIPTSSDAEYLDDSYAIFAYDDIQSDLNEDTDVSELEEKMISYGYEFRNAADEDIPVSFEREERL